MFKEVRSLQFRQAMGSSLNLGSYQSPFDFANARAQASDFSMLLKVMEKDMVALEKQIEGRSGGTRRVLGSSLVTPSWVHDRSLVSSCRNLTYMNKCFSPPLPSHFLPMQSSSTI
jgi:hypothetical protein